MKTTIQQLLAITSIAKHINPTTLALYGDYAMAELLGSGCIFNYPTGLNCVVNPEAFHRVLNKCGDTVQFTQEENQLVVMSGDYWAKLPTRRVFQYDFMVDQVAMVDPSIIQMDAKLARLLGDSNLIVTNHFNCIDSANYAVLIEHDGLVARPFVMPNKLAKLLPKLGKIDRIGFNSNGANILIVGPDSALKFKFEAPSTVPFFYDGAFEPVPENFFKAIEAAKLLGFDGYIRFTLNGVQNLALKTAYNLKMPDEAIGRTYDANIITKFKYYDDVQFAIVDGSLYLKSGIIILQCFELTNEAEHE